MQLVPLVRVGSLSCKEVMPSLRISGAIEECLDCKLTDCLRHHRKMRATSSPPTVIKVGTNAIAKSLLFIKFI